MPFGLQSLLKTLLNTSSLGSNSIEEYNQNLLFDLIIFFNTVRSQGRCAAAAPSDGKRSGVDGGNYCMLYSATKLTTAVNVNISLFKLDYLYIPDGLLLPFFTGAATGHTGLQEPMEEMYNPHILK